MLLNFSPPTLQHVTHLEALLEEHQSIPSQNLHDSDVRTLSICESRPVNLDKVTKLLVKVMLT